MQKKRTGIIVLCAILATLILTGAAAGIILLSRQDSRSADEQFEALCDEFFTDYASADVLTAYSLMDDPAAFGINPAELDLGEMNFDDAAEQTALFEGYVKRLKKINSAQLNSKNRVDYEILLNDMQASAELCRLSRFSEPLTDNGIQGMLPVYFLEMPLNSEAEAEEYLRILADVPRYFDSIIAFERRKAEEGVFMPEANCKKVIEQCEDFIAEPDENIMILLFNETIASSDGLTKQQKEAYMKKNAKLVKTQLIPAYQRMIDALTELDGQYSRSGGICELDGGRDYCNALLRAQGHKYDADQAMDILEQAMQAAQQEMVRVYQSDPRVFDKMDSCDYPSEDPNEIIEYLQRRVRADFPLPQNANCTVKQVPEVLRPYVAPAFYMLPPVDNSSANTIYLNIGDGNNGNDLFPTMAHEGYPGHLVQSVCFAETGPKPVRRIISPLAYVEGWSSYVETESYTLCGWDDSVAQLQVQNNILVMAMYAYTDLKINYDGWSFEQAFDYWKACFSIGEEDMRDMYTRMAADPCAYVDYGLGLVEMLETRRMAEDILGDDFNAKKFHCFVIAVGPCDVPLLQRYVKDWAAQKARAGKAQAAVCTAPVWMIKQAA